MGAVPSSLGCAVPDVECWNTGDLHGFLRRHEPPYRLPSRSNGLHLWSRDQASTRPNAQMERTTCGIAGDVRGANGYVIVWPDHRWRSIWKGGIGHRGVPSSALDSQPRKRSGVVGAFWAIQALRGMLSGMAQREVIPSRACATR